MGIHDDKTSVMGIHDDKTSSSRKRPNRNFSIKQNNHKFTQLRNKDLSSSLDVVGARAGAALEAHMT